MPYDLFISYSRRDNTEGRVTQLVERIQTDFAAFAERPLVPFFDQDEIRGMDDWRHRILRGLRESRLLIAVLSPSYLKSEYCEWEFNEYLKHEIGQGLVSEGIAPIYFVEVEGWTDKNFDQRAAEWVAELRRRQHFDLQPWFHQGEEALRTQAVQERMTALAERIHERIRRGELAEHAKGNIDRFNIHFSGRSVEMRLLRESASLKQVGVLTAVQGLGGIGKTALACAYAHTYAADYPGGRWQVKCEGRTDLRAALIALAGARDFEFEFSDEEKRDIDLGFERVLRELKKRAEVAEPKRVLLILDNVDQPELLAPAQTQRLPSADWLHIIATTRLGEADLGRGPDRCYVAINELPEKDAVDLIEKWQPGGSFPNEAERQAAHGIARLLGGFTLAVEAAAVYLGQNAGEITCAGFKARLEKEGLGGLEVAVSDPAVRVQHDEKRLSVTLQPTLDRLSPPEKLVLIYAALLPADYVVLPWIRPLAATEFSELGKDAEPGYPDPWKKLLGKLLSLRLLQPTAEFNVLRIHRLVQELARQQEGSERLAELEKFLLAHGKARGRALFDGWAQEDARWEITPLAACALHWMGRVQTQLEGAGIGVGVANPLHQLARYPEAEPLYRRALTILENSLGPVHPQFATALGNLANLLKVTNRRTEAEPLCRRALTILEDSLGPDHPDIAYPLNGLANLLDDTNRRTEAEPLYRRALAIRETSLGPDHPDIATSLDSLATLLRVTNRLTGAEPLYRRALAIFEKSLGPNHPLVATSLNNLAELLEATNRQAEAEPLRLRAKAIKEKNARGST